MARKIISWWLVWALLLPLAGTARAETLSVDFASCSVKNGGIVSVGETVRFEIASTGAVRTQLMIVPPDSSRIGKDGPVCEVTLDTPGIWAFIAYAQNSARNTVHSGQWRIQVAGSEIPAEQPDVLLYTMYADNRFEWEDAARVFWVTSDAFEGSTGWLNIFKDGRLVSGVSIPASETLCGTMDVMDILRKGGRGEFRAELKLTNGTEVTGQAEITLNLYDRFMDFADLISGVNDPQEKIDFDRWRRNTRPAGNQVNSGYLMLDRLLNPEEDEGYDYEAMQSVYVAYQSVFMGLKLDLVSLIAETADLLTRGGGEKYYTDALIKTYENFAAGTLADMEGTIPSKTAEEAAVSVIDATGTLLDAFDKPLGVYKEGIDKALAAAYGSAAKHAGGLPLSFETLSPEGALIISSEISSSNSSAISNGFQELYARVLIDPQVRNSEAGKQFLESYETFQKVKDKTVIPDAASNALNWGGFILSGAMLAYDTVQAAGHLNDEKQQAAAVLLKLANASETYMRCARTLLNESTYRTDDPARKGMREYVRLLEQVLNATLEDASGKGLDKLAHDIAWQKSAGEFSALLVPASGCIIAGVKAVKGFDILEHLGFSNPTQLAAFVVTLVSTGFQAAYEWKTHFSDKFVAARDMYVLKQLIQDSSMIIESKQLAYAKAPTREKAIELCGLVNHHKALKQQGELAAWAFVSYDLNDTINQLYTGLRDGFFREIYDTIGIGWLTDRMGSPLYAMDDFVLFKFTEVQVNGEKVSCDSFLDLAMLADACGADQIRLKFPGSDEVFPLYGNEVSFLEKCAAMHNMTTDIFQRDFKTREKWIEAYDIPR